MLLYVHLVKAPYHYHIRARGVEVGTILRWLPQWPTCKSNGYKCKLGLNRDIEKILYSGRMKISSMLYDG